MGVPIADTDSKTNAQCQQWAEDPEFGGVGEEAANVGALWWQKLVLEGLSSTYRPNAGPLGDMGGAQQDVGSMSGSS